MSNDDIGRLWWIADDQKEADLWVRELEEKGCKVEKLDPSDFPRVSVVFSLSKSRATEILGYEPAEEDWLDMETPEEDQEDGPRP